MLKALEQSESLFSRYYLNEDFNDIKFDFELRDDIVIGQPFSYVPHPTSVEEDSSPHRSGLSLIHPSYSRQSRGHDEESQSQ